jgi:HEPN domain-containing protein
MLRFLKGAKSFMKKRRKKVPMGLPQEWLNHAASDLALARLGLNSKDVLPEQICFHAQQTVEKAIKAVLLYRGIKFPLVHDIEELLEVARQEKLQLPDWAEDMVELTPYAVEVRYPGYEEVIQETEVEQALDIAQRAIMWAKSVLVAKGEVTDVLASTTEGIISMDTLVPFYTLRRPDEVKEFLQTYPFLLPLIIEAYSKIQTYFESDPSLVLEVVTGQDTPGDCQLVVFIQTNRQPEDALARLDRLNAEWWREASHRSQNKLCIHIEYRGKTCH